MKRLGTLLLLLASTACSSEGLAPIAEPTTETPAETPGEATPPPAETTTPPGPVAPACDPSVPRTTPLTLAVQPEATAAPFVSLIESATKTIRVMVYQMGYGAILEGLEAKAKAGVKVQIILDLAQKNVNQKYMDRLKAAGADVIWSDPQFTYMHAKMILADEREAIISTGNYHESFMAKERNFAVRDSDAADVDVLVKLFDADFSRTAPNLSCTRLLVSPVNAKERLLGFIKSAKKDIAVESMQLAEREVRDALAERKAAGVTVRVLLADPNWIDANADAAVFLAQKSIPARHMKSPSVHAKAIVVDFERAYAGSVNLSWTSLTKNREIGVIVDEPANVKTMSDTFDKDWASATPF